jgi:hypothetical protein
MSKLYDSFKDGDLRTVVRRFDKGATLRMADSNIVMKSDVKMKVTEQYSAVQNVWVPCKYFLNDMVEVTYEETRPPPTHMPGAGEPQIPEARTRPASLSLQSRA